MTVCSRPTSAALRRCAVWLYSTRSHQWRATYSGRTTIVIGASLVGRPGLVEDVEVGDDRPDQRAVRRLDDHQRHARQLAFPARAQRLGLVRVVGHEDRPHVAWRSVRPKLTAWTTARLMPLTGMTTRCSRCGPAITRSVAHVARAPGASYWRRMNSIIATRIGMRTSTSSDGGAFAT